MVTTTEAQTVPTLTLFGKTVWRDAESGFTLRAECVSDDDNDFDGALFTDKNNADVEAERTLRAAGFAGMPWAPFVFEVQTRGGPAWYVPPVENYRGVSHAELVLYCEQDVERMRGFFLDEWQYMGVVVRAYLAGVRLGYASLWRIESDSGDDYLTATCRDLAADAIATAREKLAELRGLPAITFSGAAWDSFAAILREWAARERSASRDYEFTGAVLRLTTAEGTRDIKLQCVEVPDGGEYWHIGFCAFDEDDPQHVPPRKEWEWLDLQDIVEIHLY